MKSRSITALTLGLLSLARPLAGQSEQEVRGLVPIHHGGSVPDYAYEIARAGLAAIRTPPPPIEPPTLEELHHSRAVPDYGRDILPPPPTHIPIPPPPPGEPPAVVRGLYLNAWVFGSARFYSLVELADTTEINAFVIDVKDATGHVAYRSGVATAIAIGANGMVRAPDVRARLALLRFRGIHPIARIVVARDPLLAKRKPEWAVRDVNGGLWRDGLGEPWVDTYQDSVWLYAADLAAEAVLLGFREVQFDYVRFPDEPAHRLERASYPSRRPGETRRSAVRRRVALLRDRVAPLGVPFTLDVFGLTTSAEGDMGIGQNWDDLAGLADVMLPMVYPSHYPRGSFGFRYPNAQPYEVVRRAVEDALRRNEREGHPVKVRPYLQAFTLRRPRYTAREVRAQIRAVEDLGLTDWILWNARGVYPAEALRPERVPVIMTAPAGQRD
ncbi:MAG: putative glycoside hydrolase [Gemmatimonadales bacterium]